MYLKKDGFPEENELVLCTVTNIHFHCVFVDIDEYSKQGMIHISEVSPGRIRNIRDFVKEGKKVICKVLKVKRDKGHIDLSLRRVNDSQRREKLNEIKQEQLAENIVQFVAKKHKIDPKQLFKKIRDAYLDEYETLYEVFEDIRDGKIDLSKTVDKNLVGDFVEVIEQRIKIPEVEIKVEFNIQSYDPDGVELIQKAFKKAKQVKGDYVFKYKGAGKYTLLVKSEEYKSAEKVLNSLHKALETNLAMDVEFDRK